MLFGKNVNKYYLKYAHFFIIGIIALIAVDWFQLKIPDITGSIIDAIEANELTMEMLLDAVKEIVIVIVIMFSGRFLWRICMFGNGARIETDLRADLFRKAEKLSQSYYQENKVGSLMALYTNDLQTVRQSMGQGTIMCVDALFLGAFALYKMFMKNAMLTLISALPLFFLAFASVFLGRFMQKKFKKRQEAFANLSDFAQENFSGLSVIKAFLKEKKELERFKKINKDNMDKNLDYVKLAMLLDQFLFGFFIGCIFVILYGVGAVYIKNDPTFTAGELTSFVLHFGSLIWPFMAIAQLINLTSQAKASMKRIDEVLNHEVEVYDKDDVITDHEINGRITIKGLNFTYPNSSREVLSDINLDIEKGLSVGLIGPTGCGKTTLVDLLLRIYNVEEGKIFLDGVDIMKLPIKKVREAVSYVPQDNFLFSDTIANNIGFSYDKDNINLDEVRKAGILSDVDENVMEFTDQYSTVLGERGVTVSGGQKQRISIARALMKNSEILILDDSVSAVDTKTEETIIKNLKELRKGKTTILIAHRITTVKKLDKIIVMSEGKIIGYGTHDELEQTCEEYKNMVYLQRLEDDMGEDYE